MPLLEAIKIIYGVEKALDMKQTVAFHLYLLF